MTWYYGTVTTCSRTDTCIGLVLGENGKTYKVRDNSFAPEDRAHALRVGQRVRFEDRQGYIFDLRVVGGQQ